MVTRLKAYKFRFYPTAQQRHQLAVEFGNARFVWNRCLDWRSKAWEERQERHNYASLNRQVTAWKRTEFPWLADSAACCLTQCLMDQDRAFKNFFEKRGRYPKFKSRYDRQAVRYQLDQRQIERTYRAGEFLKLPKLGALNLRWSQIPTGVPKMATVSKTPDGRYFVSFACEVEIALLPLTGLEFCRRHGIACQANPYGGIGTNRFVPRKDYVGPWFVSEMHPNGVTEWMVRPIAVAGIVQLVELDRQPMPRQAPKRLGDDNGERRA